MDKLEEVKCSRYSLEQQTKHDEKTRLTLIYALSFLLANMDDPEIEEDMDQKGISEEDVRDVFDGLNQG